MLNFYARLKMERQRLGMSQTKFGEACGVTKLSQSNYESGKRNPDLAYLSKAGEIGCDINFIMTGKIEEFIYLENRDKRLPGDGKYTLAFRKDWIESRGLELSNLVLTTQKDDGMEPFMMSGDDVLLDVIQRKNGNSLVHGMPDDQELTDGIYEVKLEKRSRIRRLNVNEDGMVDVLCENPDYKTLHWPLDEARKKVVGRVVWLAREINS